MEMAKASTKEIIAKDIVESDNSGTKFRSNYFRKRNGM